MLEGAGAATVALAGAALGIGNVFYSLTHSVARNPPLAKQLFGYATLGFSLTEAIALFALMLALGRVTSYLILFVLSLILSHNMVSGPRMSRQRSYKREGSDRSAKLRAASAHRYR